jgi:polyisoprenoid-binding protein YceI
MRLRTWLITGVALVVIGVVAFVAYGYYFAGQVNPDRQTPTGPTASSCGTAIATTSDMHTFKLASGSTASFQVNENLIIKNKPNTDAVGKTQDVNGSFSARSTQSPLVAGLSVTVNLSTLTSDERQRDNYIKRNTLETDKYPNAAFVSSCVQGMPASYTEGQEITFKMIGNLTIHGKTNEATFDVIGKLSGKTIAGSATSEIFMTDYGMQPPNLANIAIAQNKVLLTLQFTANEG